MCLDSASAWSFFEVDEYKHAFCKESIVRYFGQLISASKY